MNISVAGSHEVLLYIMVLFGEFAFYVFDGCFILQLLGQLLMCSYKLGRVFEFLSMINMLFYSIRLDLEINPMTFTVVRPKIMSLSENRSSYRIITGCLHDDNIG